MPNGVQLPEVIVFDILPNRRKETIHHYLSLIWIECENGCDGHESGLQGFNKESIELTSNYRRLFIITIVIHWQ